MFLPLLCVRRYIVQFAEFPREGDVPSIIETSISER